jgi:uncharacterized protein (DUF4415 family)
VNVILGGGDVGKTTILEAIALLFSPVNPTTLSDPDYHDRDIEAGFFVETRPRRKASVHLRLDHETLAFYHSAGRGHLTWMANILKAYAETKAKAQSKR